MRRSLTGSLVRLLALALLLSACASGMPTAPPTPQLPATGARPLELTNATTMKVQMLVNGTAVGEAEPNSQLSIPADQLPAYPWHVEATTTAGRTLASMDVTGDVQRTTLPDGGVEIRGFGARVGLSCGLIVLFYGPPPNGPAIEGPFPPGDCDP